MGLKRVRENTNKDKGNGVKGKEPLTDRLSRFNYEVTQKQLVLFIKIKAKIELRKIAETGKGKERRIEAIKGIAEIDDKESIPILEEILRTDPEEEARDEAGKTILKLKGEEQKFVEKDGIEELDIAEIMDGAIDFIGPATEEDYPDFEIEDPEAEKRLQEYAKKAAIEKLKGGDGDNLYMVIELALMEDNKILQKNAIEALIDFDDRNALNTAKMIVGDDEYYEEFRKKIEFRLSALTVKEFQEGDESKLPEVAQILFKNENFGIRQTAFEALITAKNLEAMDAVRLYLTEEEKDLSKRDMSFKRHMLKEMDEIRHPKFLDAFIEVLRFTSDQKVMDILISSLFMYGSKKSIEVLEYTSNRDDINDGIKKDAITAATLLRGL